MTHNALQLQETINYIKNAFSFPLIFKKIHTSRNFSEFFGQRLKKVFLYSSKDCKNFSRFMHFAIRLQYLNNSFVAQLNFLNKSEIFTRNITQKSHIVKTVLSTANFQIILNGFLLSSIQKDRSTVRSSENMGNTVGAR